MESVALKRWQTTDFNFSGYLLAEGVKLLDVVAVAHRKFAFVFEDGPQIETLRHAYFNDAKIGVQRYVSACRMVRSFMKTNDMTRNGSGGSHDGNGKSA